MAYTYNATLMLGSSQTGLSLKAALIDAAGTIHATLRDITAGFYEVGGGMYSWVTASMPDGYRGTVVFYVGSLGPGATDFNSVTKKAATPVSPQEVENTDIKTSAISVTGAEVNLVDGAITEAKFTLPAEAAGRPTGFMGMLRRLFEWKGNKRVRNRATGAVRLYGADDATVLETQTQSTTGSSGSETDAQTRGI